MHNWYLHQYVILSVNFLKCMIEITCGLDDPKMLFISLPLGGGVGWEGKEMSMIINNDY